MEYLVAVADARSVTSAAEKKGVSAPSISVAILQLEAEFGVALFVRRHAQGMNLTPQGVELLELARSVLDRSADLVKAARILSGSVKGDLTVGCLCTFAHIILPRLRRAFSTRYPNVDFHQVETHQMEIVEAVRDARMDLALTYDLAIPTDLSFLGLAELPPFVLLPDGHQLSHRSTLSVSDLVNEPMILLDLPHSSDYFLSFFDRLDLKPVIFERTRDMALVQSMVASGFGYSIANVKPRSDESPDGGKLKLIPLIGEVKPLRMGIVHSSSAHHLPTVKAFFEMCQQTLPDYVRTSLTVSPTMQTSDSHPCL